MGATRRSTLFGTRGRIGTRQRRRRNTLVGVAAMAALAAVVVGTTGAYFTSSNGLAGQTATVATLAAPTTFTAQKATPSGGVAGGSTAIAWSDAKSLPWATSNPSATAKYTVERSTTGSFDDPASVTTVARDATGLSVSDTIGSQATGTWQAQQVEAFLPRHGTVSLINGRVFLQGTITKEESNTRIFAEDFGVPTEITGWGAQVNQIAAGRDHICGLLVTGAVQCWGFNSFGQLGNGTQIASTSTSAPVYISDVGGVFRDKAIVGIDAGMSFTCAWTADGTIGCWGANEYGQLGNPGVTGAVSTTPVVVVPAKATPSATGTLAKGPLIGLATGEYHTCAVRGPVTAADGTVTTPGNNERVVCWGRNNWKQLGENVTQNDSARNPTPIAIKDTNNQFTGVTSISSGEAVSCVVNDKTDAANIACWGGGGLGLLGDGVAQEVAVPKAITSTVRGFTKLAIGKWHSCGVTTTVYTCWGTNFSGQLGNGVIARNDNIQPPQTPVAISRYLGTAAGTPVSLGIGWQHTCLTTTDGSMVCWGQNGSKQLGQNTSTEYLAIPTAVIMNIGTSAAPVYSPMRPRLIAQSSSSDFAALFVNGNAYKMTHTAALLSGFPNDLTQISAGDQHVCAVSASRGVMCSGDNTYGQLGTGNTTASTSAVAISTATGDLAGKQIVDLALSSNSSCALAVDGTLSCWGLNSTGELGDGTTTNRPAPTRVSNPSGMFTGASNQAQEVAAGTNFFCVSSRSAVACWGGNGNSQLGDGTTNSAIQPRKVASAVFDGGALSMSASIGTACAIAAPSGRAYCWGRNDFGQAGSGGTVNPSTPQLVATSTRFSGVGAGGNASCGWTADEVQCWGSNRLGAIGSGTITDDRPAAPRKVGDTQAVLRSGIAHVSVGSAASCVVSTVQAVSCWGYSSANGNGTQASTATPQLITGIDKPGGGAPACLDGATLLADGRSCSLSPTLPYSYRLTYTVSGADNWKSTPAIAARPQ